MKTKNKASKTSLPGFRETPEETAQREIDDAKEQAAASSNGNKKERVTFSFDVDESGSPDFSSMRDKTKERVKQFFTDPKIAEQFGARPGAAAPEVQIFHPAMVSGLYDMLGAIEATVAQRYGKIPQHIAKQVFTYTPAEKDALAGPTVRVLNKYAAEWMIRFQDEIALATILISLTVAKVNAAITLSKMSQGQSVEMPKKEESESTPQPN
jgi:hypothetical protein